jgi:hemerythrin-like metal-binding protein
MSLIKWNDTLSVGVQSIDKQHQKLVDLVNDFYDGFNQGSPQEKISELLLGMKNYTVMHFTTEEKIMRETNFPGYSKHKEDHDKFVETVLDLEKRFNSGKLIITFEITNFLKKWITDHIKVVDKEYTEHFQSKGVM